MSRNLFISGNTEEGKQPKEMGSKENSISGNDFSFILLGLPPLPLPFPSSLPSPPPPCPAHFSAPAFGFLTLDLRLLLMVVQACAIITPGGAICFLVLVES